MAGNDERQRVFRHRLADGSGREWRSGKSGEVTTYGDLAGLAGSPLASRAVGQAMAKNPLSLIVPCHRVLGSSGKLGGFSAHGGVETKLRLLEFEQGKG